MITTIPARRSITPAQPAPVMTPVIVLPPMVATSPPPRRRSPGSLVLALLISIVLVGFLLNRFGTLTVTRTPTAATAIAVPAGGNVIVQPTAGAPSNDVIALPEPEESRPVIHKLPVKDASIAPSPVYIDPITPAHAAAPDETLTGQSVHPVAAVVDEAKSNPATVARTVPTATPLNEGSKPARHRLP